MVLPIYLRPYFDSILPGIVTVSVLLPLHPFCFTLLFITNGSRGPLCSHLSRLMFLIVKFYNSSIQLNEV